MFNAFKEQIEWYRMKKIAAAHPFFAMKGRLLSRRDAELLLRGREIPDGKEVVRLARAELGIPEPADNGATSTPKLTGLQGLLSTRALRNGIAIAASLVLLCGFFAFSNTGRAFAENIYKVIVSIFDGSLQSRNENAADNIQPIDFSKLPSEFESLEEIAELTGRPIIVSGNGNDTLTQFTTRVVGKESLAIVSYYAQGNGSMYTLVQTLYNGSSSWGGFVSTVDENVVIVEIPLGIKAYLSTMTDGTVYAEAYGLGYDINVSSSDMCLNDIQELMLNCKLLDE